MPLLERNPVDPISFSPFAYHCEWRKKVGKWVVLIKADHDSGADLCYHTLLKILDQTFYTRSIRREKKRINLTKLKRRKPSITIKRIDLPTMFKE